MLIGGWSNAISVTGPRARTWRRSLMSSLHREQLPDRILERDARSRTTRTVGQHVDRGEYREQRRHGIGDRHASEARRVVPRRPPAAALRGKSVARTVAVSERRDP